LDPTSKGDRVSVRRHAEYEECKSITDERQGDNVDGLEDTETTPPENRAGKVYGRDNVELRGTLTDFTRKKGDLVRICCEDLALGFISMRRDGLRMVTYQCE
jgi:hypothetical protein